MSLSSPTVVAKATVAVAPAANEDAVAEVSMMILRFIFAVSRPLS